MNDIIAVVLAAGKSERMGSPKMLLPFCGQTIIEVVIDNILSSGIREILVVLGSDRVMIESVVRIKPVRICYNPDFEKGMHTSVICGFSALPAEARAVMVFLGDQPFIPPEVIRSVAYAWNQTGKGIVLPVFRGKRGHPVLFDLRLKEAVMQPDPLSGLRSVIDRFQDEISEVEVNFPQILRDIDTKNDYITELNLMEQKWKRKSDSY